MSMHFYRNKNTYLACVDNLIVSQVDYITKIKLCQHYKKHLLSVNQVLFFIVK